MLSKNQIKWVRSLELKKNRREKGVFVAEGPKVVGDLLRAGYKAHTIFCIREAEYATVDARLVAVTSEELCKLSFLQHPQEVLAVFEIPNSLATACREPKALCLALDGIQDPGNLGTIIRIADWFGIDTIYCSEDTADVYNPKVVQATMGALGKVNVAYTPLPQWLCSLPGDIPIYGTFLNGSNIYEASLTPNGIIVMGNEGRGISPQIADCISHRLYIPPYPLGQPDIESLNVGIATSITCAEFRRRLSAAQQ
jgi:TrmH family RNA methyltransferase